MKLIIAGSRTITDIDTIYAALDFYELDDITEIVSGTAKGVDQLGEQFAEIHNIPVKKFPADWNRFGKAAGYKRNAEMAHYADKLLAIWNGRSKGTGHMINLMKKINKTAFIFYVK